MLIRVTVKTAGHKIAMIKLVRTLTDMGLKEAKDFVEANMANMGDTFLVRVDNPTKAFTGLTSFDTSNWDGSPAWADLVTITVEAETPVKLTI